MRVLIVNTAYDPDLLGGAEHSVRELADGLLARGIETRAVSLSRTGGGYPAKPEFVRRIPSRAFDQFVSRRPRPAWRKLVWHLGEIARFREYAQLRSEIKKFSPNVVHLNNLAGFGWLAWLAVRDLPSIQTCRDYSLICTSATGMHDGVECNGRRISCRLLKAAYTWRWLQPSYVVGITSYVSKRMSLNGVRGKDRIVRVVHNSPTVPKRVPHAPIIADFGFLGQVTPEKGVEVLLEAFSVSTLPAATRLALGGVISEQYLAHLREKFADLFSEGRVVMAGRTDPGTFFSSVRVAVVPTQWQEPFGRVAAEALGMGLPLVYSAVGGLVDVPRIYGGIVREVAPADSVEAWARALEDAYGERMTTVNAQPGLALDSTDAYLDLYKTATDGWAR